MTRISQPRTGKVAPKGWSLDTAKKVAAVEGLVVTAHMEQAISRRGDAGRKAVHAVVSKD
ncbi:hypothetical protein [Pelagibacterium montanilacus]|uniref:hypothetical protein n=1 Tax=Pelagibacterium montanilacus TaxID=2185280 RepID=UPI000F8D8924|nr:hypothetical protein [Pelagibacterium montanilacus]